MLGRPGPGCLDRQMANVRWTPPSFRTADSCLIVTASSSGLRGLPVAATSEVFKPTTVAVGRSQWQLSRPAARRAPPQCPQRARAATQYCPDWSPAAPGESHPHSMSEASNRTSFSASGPCPRMAGPGHAPKAPARGFRGSCTCGTVLLRLEFPLRPELNQFSTDTPCISSVEAMNPEPDSSSLSLNGRVWT